MTLRAAIFIHRSLAFGAGHVGWAFELRNGMFNVGSVENCAGTPWSLPDRMDFWTVDTFEPVRHMRQRSYDAFKMLQVDTPNPEDAWQTMMWMSRQPYVVLGRNCLDDVYDVLRAYGVSPLPIPTTQLLPNRWFDSFPGQVYDVKKDTLPLRGTARVLRHLPMLRDRQREIPVNLAVHAPTWRAEGTEAWQAFCEALNPLTTGELLRSPLQPFE